MEINYSYKLVGLNTVKSFNGLEDVVVSVDFIMYAEIEGLPKIDWALAEVPVNLPDNTTFKPLDQLTEEEIVSWVIDAPQIPQVKDSLRRVINKKLEGREYISWNNEPTLMETQNTIPN